MRSSRWGGDETELSDRGAGWGGGGVIIPETSDGQKMTSVGGIVCNGGDLRTVSRDIVLTCTPSMPAAARLGTGSCGPESRKRLPLVLGVIDPSTLFLLLGSVAESMSLRRSCGGWCRSPDPATLIVSTLPGTTGATEKRAVRLLPCGDSMVVVAA